MSDARSTAEHQIWMFGVAGGPVSPMLVEAGNLRVHIANGAVVGVFWGATEIVTGIDYPIRDVNWGTWPATALSEHVDTSPASFSYERRFAAGDFEGEFRCAGKAEGELRLEVRLTALRATRTCRAGFVVLHPLAAAGEGMEITDETGKSVSRPFPRLIAPAQPAMDIVRLSHRIGAIEIDMRFAGEIFEMEDQRNWSDASFKTFCRPLSKPYPFDSEAGETIEQAITLRVSGPPGIEAPSGSAVSVGAADECAVPEVGLALDPAWPLTGRLGDFAGAFASDRFVARVDAARRDHLDWLAGRAQSLGPRAFDLECVVDGDPETIASQLRGLSEIVSSGKLALSRLMVLPRAYLQCIQPWHPAPAGASPAEAIEIARGMFPEAALGSGMLTNFTELNRCPPYLEGVGYVTHSLTPIVHAADDASVMGALDTLEPIFATLDHHACGLPYRLGLAAIGMRSNPYGADVADNREQERLAMAGADPRQRGLFGAAFLIGVIAATAGRAFDFLVAGAPYGPFGLAYADAEWRQPLFEDDPARRAYPLYHAYRWLQRVGGKTRLKIETPAGVRAVAALAERKVLAAIANCTDRAAEVALPREGLALVLDGASAPDAARDPDWLANAARRSTARLELEPYAVAFVEMEE